MYEFPALAAGDYVVKVGPGAGVSVKVDKASRDAGFDIVLPLPQGPIPPAAPGGAAPLTSSAVAAAPPIAGASGGLGAAGITAVAVGGAGVVGGTAVAINAADDDGENPVSQTQQSRLRR